MGRRAVGVEIVNPARAGMILSIVDKIKPALSKPRASGDDPPAPLDHGLRRT